MLVQGAQREVRTVFVGAFWMQFAERESARRTSPTLCHFPDLT